MSSSKHKNFEQLLGENAEKIEEFSAKELIGLAGVLGVNLFGVDADNKEALINRIKTVLNITSSEKAIETEVEQAKEVEAANRKTPLPKPRRPPRAPKPDSLSTITDGVVSADDPAVIKSPETKKKWFNRASTKEDPFNGAEPLPAMTKDIAKPTGLRTGNLEMSSKKLESAMDAMLKDAEKKKGNFRTDPSIKPKNKSLESTLAVIDLRAKVPDSAVIRRTSASGAMDMSKRTTCIPQEFYASEEDLLSAVQEDELMEFEQGAMKIAETSVDDSIPMIEPELNFEYEMTEFTAGEEEDQLTFKLKCLDVTWFIEKSFTECQEMRDELAGNTKYANLADNFPIRDTDAAPTKKPGSFKRKTGSFKRKAAPAEDVSKEGKKRELWLDNWFSDLFKGIPVLEFGSIDYLDDFFEAFWNFEEARKRAPLRVDYLAHMQHTRETAEQLLKKKAPGTFLVRHKKTGGDLVISCSHDDGTFWHGIVDISTVDGEQRYALRGTALEHIDLEELITHYLKKPYAKSHGKLWMLGNFCSMGQGKTPTAAPSI